ncbi:MAG: peptidoglycan editing factor PgeF [Xanthomonadaceae bacterium]|nr:peptidoglycan editing factor PgeF [Xanthomonadaceae bacterium]
MKAALFPDWTPPDGVRALTTLRYGIGISAAPFDSFNLGMHCGDDPQIVAENRKALVEYFSLPSAPRWLRQVHGVEVVRQFAQASEAEAEADAMVTDARGVVLAILTADCLPVILAAQDGNEVAIAHAGWRGLAGGVLEAAVAMMETTPDRLIAWLGPAAGPEIYEVGEEVRDAFVQYDPATAAAFCETRPSHWRADLYALARRRLQAAGMAATSVHGGGLCTISDSRRFYSHRRDQRTGRMATLIWKQ